MPSPWWKWITVGWTWDVLSAPDMWHKLWPFRPVMCWMGRHDYGVKYPVDHGARLYCFYCLHEKEEINTSRRDREQAE